MLRRSACLGLAVSAVLASAGMVRAEENSNLSLDQPIYADTTPARRPLMAVMDKMGAGSAMDSAGINVYGFAEGSWTYNFDRPNTHTNNGRVFDFEDQDPTLNQVDLTIEKTVDATKGKFDIGFRVEMIYGGDSRLIHSNGLNFYGPEYALTGGDFDYDQEFDLNQAYVTMAIPVGSGLTLTMGKFVTLLGYETINPTNNLFYSHSYMFGFAIPFTQTGVMGKYNITKDLAFTLGISRGWEQSTKDNNGSIDGFGQLAWTVNDKLTITVNMISGPEQAHDSSHYRTVADVVAAYKLGDNTTIGMNMDYGYGSREGADVGGDGKPGTGDWWGTAIYVSQKLDSHFTANMRAEYFNDDDGARGVGLGVNGLTHGTSVEEVTLGLTVTPFPDNAWLSGLMIRPEARWDHANDGIYNEDDHNMYTIGGDLIFAF